MCQDEPAAEYALISVSAGFAVPVDPFVGHYGTFEICGTGPCLFDGNVQDRVQPK